MLRVKSLFLRKSGCKINLLNHFFGRPGDDWKKTLKLPPKDLRIKTSVRTFEL